MVFTTGGFGTINEATQADLEREAEKIRRRYGDLYSIGTGHGADLNLEYQKFIDMGTKIFGYSQRKLMDIGRGEGAGEESEVFMAIQYLLFG